MKKFIVDNGGVNSFEKFLYGEEIDTSLSKTMYILHIPSGQTFCMRNEECEEVQTHQRNELQFYIETPGGTVPWLLSEETAKHYESQNDVKRSFVLLPQEEFELMFVDKEKE